MNGCPHRARQPCAVDVAGTSTHGRTLRHSTIALSRSIVGNTSDFHSKALLHAWRTSASFHKQPSCAPVQHKSGGPNE